MRNTLILASFVLFTGQAAAQAPPTHKLGPVDFQASVRTRLELWDWFEGDAGNAYVFSGNILRFGFSQTKAKYDWQLEFAAPMLFGLPEHSSAAAPQGQFGLGATYYAANAGRRNAAMIFPKQGFVRFKGLFGDKTQSLRVGRFEFAEGAEFVPRNATVAWVKRERVAQRLLGPFGFTHAGRSFDGFQYTANRRTVFNLMAALPTRGAFQTDGWGNLRTGVAYASLGGQANRNNDGLDWRVFGFYYQDWRHIVKTDNRAAAARSGDLANIAIFTYGAHLITSAERRRGTLDYMFWTAGQSGRWGVQTQRAWAFANELGFQPKLLPRLKPWLRFGHFRGSGDGDPSDSRHQTFFQMLPTARVYARTPFYNLMNNDDLSGTLLLRPHKQWTVRGEFHSLRLASGRDLWYAGGGAFQPWSFGFQGRPANGNKGLANVWDAAVDYNPSQHLAFTGYLGHMAGHSVIRAIYPRNASGNFGYIEATYRF